MDNKVTNILAFGLGAAVGSVATWLIVKKRYEQIAQEEIDSVKEVFAMRETELTEELDEAHAVLADNERIDEETVEELMKYADISREQGYTDYESYQKKPDPTEMAQKYEHPYVIPPEEFGEFEGYQQISLTYYADAVLTDDNDNIVEDVEETVGFDSLNHFGEYEDDSVFVRNDRLKCDYEILQDQGTYEEVLKSAPYKADV